MPSFIDYYNYSFEEIVEIVNSEKFFPKRQILKEYDISTVLDGFKARGVKDLKYLLKRIRRDQGMRHYAHELKVPIEYMIILRRQLASYVPKAKPLKNLPFITKSHQPYLDKLTSLGIKNTYHILHHGKTPSGREQLAKMTGAPIDFILTLVKYADVYRCGAIKDVRARMYVENGIDTAQKLHATDAKELMERFKGISKRFDYIKMDPPLTDLAANSRSAGRALSRLEVKY
ncbi:MAG: DUF4332 domain-containing protein [Candidatus Kariarchaeaceae archaeon]|jgi:hypothetical protein